MTPQEAIELIESARKTMYLPKSKEYISDLGYALDMAIKALEQQPRPKGKWKYTEMGWFVVCNCSECGFQIDVDEANNFCPYCGADMRGESE